MLSLVLRFGVGIRKLALARISIALVLSFVKIPLLILDSIHKYIKLFTGFNENSNFMIMHSQYELGKEMRHREAGKRELKMPLKVPQPFKHTCCRDSCPLKAAFF